MPTITPLDASFGAQITHVVLADITPVEWQIVEDAFHEYGALVFPDQNLSEAEQITFGERFGSIEKVRDRTSKAAEVSNVKPDGTILQPDERRYQTLRGNEGWHTDSSYMPLAAKASILAAQVVPPTGGETELADMRDAYDKLDATTKERVAGLSACHSLYASQAKAGFVFKTGEGYGFHTAGMPLRPLVKIHPVTGRKSLFIGRHAFRIRGMEDAEGQAFLDELLDFACQAPRTYKHQWQPGDVMIWDNRCILHRACPYDMTQPRVLRHVRVAGETASELAETAPDERADAFQPSAVNA
jgi:alpha-ketoglutarate-dependent taurine dioxygenase